MGPLMLASAALAVGIDVHVEVQPFHTSPAVASVEVRDLVTGLTTTTPLASKHGARFGAGATVTLIRSGDVEVGPTFSLSRTAMVFEHDPVGLELVAWEPRLLLTCRRLLPLWGRLGGAAGASVGAALPLLRSNLQDAAMSPGAHGDLHAGVGSVGRLRWLVEAVAAITARVDFLSVRTQFPEDALVWRFLPGNASVGIRLVAGAGTWRAPR